MIQSIYTSVSNANIVPCGKKGLHISSEPIPLLRNNYLGEYRTELEKAKVRKNLGIADDAVMEWGNITGHIEDNPDLREALSYKLPEHLEDVIKEDFTSIKGALSWAIEYLSTFVTDTESIAWLKEETANIRQSILEKENLIYTQINSLSDNVLNNIKSITEILSSIQSINESIAKLNESLLSINVDANILNWIKNASSNSIELIDDSKLEVKISEAENNAISVNEQGLFVQDLSKEVSSTTLNVLNLQTEVKEILDTYVTKDLLGGSDFNFVNLNDFTQHIEQANSKFKEIDSELSKTVKTGEDGHVNTLYVNLISKDNEGSIKLTDSFEINSGIPLDVRLVKDTLDELYNIPANVCYPGMGVIVSSLSSLYILRKPLEGDTINQEYISNPNNWKCPEDLITVALTRQEYESLEEINPYVFYYIYEDEITRTQEPKRNEYLSDEEFEVAWQQWVDSLKTLSQEYMSASWGVEIENKLSKKASSESINILIEEINNIKGDGNGPSLESLNNSILELQTKDELFKERIDEILIKLEDTELGRLVNVEKEISSVKEDLSNYVTKDYIQDSENDFIFVKRLEYLLELEQFKKELAEKITTKEVNSDTITANNSLSIKDKNIIVENDRLNYDSHTLAHLEEIPVLKVLSQSDYDSLEQIDGDTYYYTYDTEENLITKSELSKEISILQQQINTLLTNTVSKEAYEALLERVVALETQNS